MKYLQMSVQCLEAALENIREKGVGDQVGCELIIPEAEYWARGRVLLLPYLHSV